ncbi:unnamed protein product [Spodoptera littoralis]|uniref:BHLH domain-containing protein n=1 Tax=Spodoptera littoralis TaxID=7109 RepID=A0A9P0MY62_SPOLI|nr:unnamed protein product [Spodoptera littoralis]CAH1637727.1 unnamed protein product [Spodoptera littoralis]
MDPLRDSDNLNEEQPRESQEPEPSSSTGSKGTRPKRGRPRGANRTPLSLEEKRARNAQYERERREELAKAQCELAEAAGCDTNISPANLMIHVIMRLKSRRRESIRDLKRVNRKLKKKIKKLESARDQEQQVAPSPPQPAEQEPDIQSRPPLPSWYAMALPSFEAEKCPDVLSEQEPDETASPSTLPDQTDADLSDLLSQEDFEKIFEALDNGWMDSWQKTPDS